MYPNNFDLQRTDLPELVDSHCHLDLEPLNANLDQVLHAARKAGVSRFLVPGAHPDNWERIAVLADNVPDVLAAYGCHPWYADLVDDQLLERLAQRLKSACAVGEIGLDPYCAVPLDVQEAGFRGQLRVAVSLGLPALIHCRKVFLRTLHILKDEGVEQVGGIMHSFSGSVEMALEFIRLGFYISISGTVTWEKAVRPRQLAMELPVEKLVLETDAPDLTPGKYKGEPNQPAYLEEILNTVASARGVSRHELAHQTSQNLFKLLKI